MVDTKNNYSDISSSNGMENTLVNNNENTGIIYSNHSSTPGVVVNNPVVVGDENKGDYEKKITKNDDSQPYIPYYSASEKPFPTGSTSGSTKIPDVNIYQHKKTLAQGMMDLSLFSANANQLRYVLENFDSHPFYYPSVILICLSLLVQVAIGVGLIWNATYNVKDDKEICIANKINNFTVIAIFLVTVINVFISVFGVADPA